MFFHLFTNQRIMNKNQVDSPQCGPFICPSANVHTLYKEAQCRLQSISDLGKQSYLLSFSETNWMASDMMTEYGMPVSSYGAMKKSEQGCNCE